MPAINVARTDTFEIQRQKINQIGNQIFNISQGGSDLATGNLKLGNGNISSPSLSFTSESGLGLYRPSQSTIGFVGDSKKFINFSPEGIFSYKDLILQQNIITDNGITISSKGSNYDAGTYENIPLTGGSGNGAEANFEVVSFDGAITNSGRNYSPGSYSNVSLVGGSGSGVLCSFSVPSIDGTLTGGSNYIPGTYTDISLTSGSGSGAVATFVISGDVDLLGNITNPGTGFGDFTDVSVQVLNVPTQTFVVTTITNPGNPPPDNVYQIDGSTQPTLNLIVGNTYRFDISDPSVSGHPLNFDDGTGQGLPTQDFIFIQKGSYGIAGSFIDLIVKPSANIQTYEYICTVHSGMGGQINVITGAEGVYGNGYQALVSSSSVSGQVTSFDIVVNSNNNGYKIGDELTFYPPDLGQGSLGANFVFEITSISYAGSVTSLQITDSGQDYVIGDILSANTADLGGQGFGFALEVTTNPGQVEDLVFESRGVGYIVSDTLSLPTGISSVSTTIPGQKFGVSTTLSTSSAQITVSTTDGIVAGMNVNGNQINIGQLAPGTTVLSVDSSTTLTLSANPTVDGVASLDFASPSINTITVPDTSSVQDGDVIVITSGNAILDGTTTVIVIDSTTLEFSPPATQAGTAVINIQPAFGVGTTPFEYTINVVGTVESVSITAGGNGYSDGDILSVLNSDLSQPVTKVVTVGPLSEIIFLGGQEPIAGAINVGDTVEDPNSGQVISQEVVEVTTVGGTITSIKIRGGAFADGSSLIKTGVTGTVYTVDTSTSLGERFYIDGDLTPDLDFYVGNTYKFDISDSTLSGHSFGLSKFPDGTNNKVENIDVTLDSASQDILVNSSNGIIIGMAVTVVSGDGVLLEDTLVEDINGNTISLSKFPLTSGDATITFSGVEYLQGVTKTTTDVFIKITSETVSPLYYYCGIHPDMGGDDGNESSITIDPNNPKTFGSGFQLTVAQISTSDVFVADIESGNLTINELNSTNVVSTNATVSTSLTCNEIIGEQISINTIVSSNGLTIQTTEPSTFQGNLRVGSNTTITTSGNITSSGTIRSNGSFSASGKILISNDQIQTTTGVDLNLSPAPGRIAKITNDTALVIPVGDTNSRPLSGVGGLAQDGSIRFNTDNNQYEGYNSSSDSWSSLGGVRDIDGNTYILAELTAGANDNTLWFFNDNNNSLKLTPEFLDFRNVKKISSTRLGLPAFTLWTANTPVLVGQYIKYRNNLYEVTGSGTTATVGSEPVHLSGAVNNGTSQLTWFSSAVSPLTFTEIEELRVAPNKDAALVINGGLKLGGTTSEDWNTISTLVEDLTIAPNPGKKVVIKSYTHFAIPAGNNNQKNIATAVPGSIRFNTEIQQFEGYSGTNWSSLGGVRDVDGNTYIIPETAPAANENILYFYNDNLNTMRLTKTSLDFTNIDTITTSGLNNLSIDTPLVTLNSNDTTIDNRDVDRTFISTSKQFLDLGLSSGLVVDPVLRLDDQGDVYLNTTFGSGTFNGVKVLDGQLKEFELADYAIKTTTFQLAKGGAESGSFVLYDSGSRKGCKVTVVSKSSSGKRSMTEYSVIDNGTDIFHNEFGSLNTSFDQYTASFDFNAINETRISLTLSNDHANGDIITFTVLVQVIK
jgi:hypothetical protein